VEKRLLNLSDLTNPAGQPEGCARCGANFFQPAPKHLIYVNNRPTILCRDNVSPKTNLDAASAETKFSLRIPIFFTATDEEVRNEVEKINNNAVAGRGGRGLGADQSTQSYRGWNGVLMCGCAPLSNLKRRNLLISNL